METKLLFGGQKHEKWIGTSVEWLYLTSKTHYDRKGNEYLLEQLEVALDKLEHNVQDEIDEARATYKNINTICFANHLHLEKDEEALLEKIKEVSMSNGWLGGLNSWNTTNTWPGK